ncbi:hypothetical protein BCR33DRAFT_262263 [Rhizoclosmatium globosum]|uniref:Glycosyltransferase 61 catalytic domain-containing protein n=1 Tax=Rhizoclosmatium globosum TaxID=329046 RepID=A0A1Y2C8X3_9FUNG|nr:hypothetical protein BCR33DRAFT_262263 [Rhizoclosmatium globosum]|eukprot:ORY43480.1 hypothetical protein BCR33DRAFT_262263 [Rhizoclosmatium globosum]
MNRLSLVRRLSLRQALTLATWLTLGLVLVVLAVQLVALLTTNDFKHPSTSPDSTTANLLVKQDIVITSSPSIAKLQVHSPGPSLFLSQNQHFAQRSVRLPIPKKGSKESSQITIPTKNTRRYSHMRCTGDEKSINGRRERICTFENVCYNTAAKEWNYFVRPDSPRKAILYDEQYGERYEFWEKEMYEFPLGFLPLSGFSHGSTDFGFEIKQAQSPAVTDPSNTAILTNLHALFHLAVHDDNLGHLLWEEMGMLWYSMIRMNSYSDDMMPLHMLGPLPDRKLSHKFRNAFMKAITKNAPQDLETYTASLQKPNICFDQLLVGGNQLRFFQNAFFRNIGHEPLFYSLRNRILQSHGIDPSQPPSRHRIVFTNKTETLKMALEGNTLAKNRGIQNLAEAVAHIKKLYPTTQVDVIEWQKLDMAAQLQLMHSTTIFISPCGGVSTLLPFLPEGAHAIIVDYFDRVGDSYYGTRAGTSVSMEAPMWNYIPHVKKLYYQVWGPQDLVSDVEGKKVEDVDWRYEVSTKIDLGSWRGLLKPLLRIWSRRVLVAAF